MAAIVLDVETTGLSPHSDRIIEVAIVSFVSGAEYIHTYVDPECHISDEITNITGITDDDVRGQPCFRDIAGDIARAIEQADAVVGYNPFFDRGFLSAELERCDMPVEWPLLACCKRLWDIHEPKEKRHLMNAYKRFVDREGFDGAHGALEDTLATRKVLIAQLKEFSLIGIPWEEFDPGQKKWLGPSGHIIVDDGVLIFNIGKHKGTPCHEVPKGFWKWLLNKDFPEHVNLVAEYLTAVKPKATAEELYSWAYGRFM